MTNLDLFCELLGGSLPRARCERLYQHYELLRKWNERINLTTIMSMDEAVERHYRECLFLAERLPPGPSRLLDLGSGAGFPGIPVAVARPDLQVTLAEANQRKAAFLKEATRDLRNVNVVVVRAESLQQCFDWVTLRAVRWEKAFATLGKRFALLVSDKDLQAITGEIRWQEPLRLPGSQHGILLFGEAVPRGT